MAKMGGMNQLASATVAVVFSTAMLFAAHFFTEYRATRSPAIAAVPPFSSPLDRRLPADRTDSSRKMGYITVGWPSGAI